jgi:hypothetical protein
MSGVEIRLSTDVDQPAFGIKDPVGGAGVPGKKATKRTGVAALRSRMLHVPLIQRVVQCVNRYWMFQCSTPLVITSGALVLCLVHRSLFDLNKEVKADAGCSRYY